MPPADGYRKQAALQIKVVPPVAVETSFALKGGTAINLFLRDMRGFPSISIWPTFAWPIAPVLSTRSMPPCAGSRRQSSAAFPGQV